ncbi:MAG TPA: 50S ribosomal protein L4 [Vicinamibacteria bacterium]|nr:50S ribosomal protein L4 [Vicinamibacteria bacterium]
MSTMPEKQKKAPAEKATNAGAKSKPEGPSVPSVAVVDAQNRKLTDIALHPGVFGVEVNDHLLYEAVKHYRAGGRSGTHMTKNRALVSGTGKKPWKQKGTGRARAGEARNPLWRHGGTVFGPVPRDYSYSMPKKARAAALRSALSQRVNEGALRVIDRFGIEQPKTKALKGLLDQLGLTGKTLILDTRPADALLLSGRNIPGVKVVDVSHLQVYDLLDCRTVLASQDALQKLEERLAS